MFSSGKKPDSILRAFFRECNFFTVGHFNPGKNACEVHLFLYLWFNVTMTFLFYQQIEGTFEVMC